MSLRIWLPMNRDLRNQGLDDVTITNNGATFNSAGKLGGCYNFNNSVGIGATNITLGNTFSIACWIKVNSYNSNWANAFKIYKDSYDYIGLCMNQTSASTKQLGFHIYKNNGSNARTSVYDSYYMPLTIGVWYHLCFVVTTSEVKTYQNGVSIRTGSITTTFPSVSNYNLGLGKSSLFGGLDCSINDFRLYNHALSQMEVKELSKGLVLHYPLNRGGWGQENLFRNSGFLEHTTQGTWDTSLNGNLVATYWGGYNGGVSNPTTGYHAHLYLLNNEYVYRYVEDGHNRWKGVSQGGLQDKLTANTTYTFSVDQFITTDSGNFLFGGLYYYSTGASSASFGIGQFSAKGLEQNKWVRFTYTFTTPNNIDLTKGVGWYIYGMSSSAGTIYMRRPKLEKGSIATPWCPNSSDNLAAEMGLNGTTEYDCSGYCNNGTRTGTFEWTSDTPKYQVSTKFDTTSTKIKLPVMSFTGMANSYTFAWWQYNVSTNNMPWGFSDGNRLNCYHCSPLCWNTGDGSNNQFKNGSTTIAPATVQNGWHHMVVTGDGTATKLYIDGVYKGTATTYKPLTGTQIWISGWDSGTSYTFSGSKECDFRIYATALSADDVKSLYQNCATIDPDRTIRGQIRS